MQGEIRERVHVPQKNQRRSHWETRWKNLSIFWSIRSFRTSSSNSITYTSKASNSNNNNIGNAITKPSKYCSSSHCYISHTTYCESSLTPKTKQNNLKPVMIFSPFGQSSNELKTLPKKKDKFLPWQLWILSGLIWRGKNNWVSYERSPLKKGHSPSALTQHRYYQFFL